MSVCLSTPGEGGVPPSFLTGGGVARSFLTRGVPHTRSGWRGGAIPGQDGRGSYPRSGWGDTPSQVRTGGGTSILGQNGGYPPSRSGPRSGWGYPPPIQVRTGRVTPNRNTTACTCYAADGILAFTQEDFLVGY